MNPFFPSSKPKPKKKAAADSHEIDKPHQTINSLDTFKISGDSVKSGAFDLGKTAITKSWEQLLGVDSYANDGYQPGVDYTPAQIKQMQEAQAAKQEKPKQIETTAEHSKYVQEISGNANIHRESQESEQRIQSLITELRRLASSVQTIEKAVVLQAVGPGNAKQMKGKYYENFFEWMLLVVQDARRKVEDSGAWLQTMTGKSKGKQAVGKMKKNMSQLLSGERTASNQSG